MLRARQFDVALVDIISNECGLALAAALKLPVVGFWGFSFVGGEVRRQGSVVGWADTIFSGTEWSETVPDSGWQFRIVSRVSF